MAESKTYIARKQNFIIHRGPEYVQMEQGGELVTVKETKEPIEFSNCRLTTDDPEIQETIESDDAFGDDLSTADVAEMTAPEDLEEAAEEAPSSDLEARLEDADSQEEVAEILDDEGYPAPSAMGDPADTSEGGEEAAEDEEPEGTEVEPYQGDLQVIEGVTNKEDALAALGSIQGIDFGVSSADNVDAIAEAAEKEGYTFDGWPK